jgi:hypothetical protein
MRDVTHVQLRVILLKGTVSAIIQRILNSPMLSHHRLEPFGRPCRGGRTRDAVSGLLLRLAQGIRPLTFELEDLGEARPEAGPGE